MWVRGVAVPGSIVDEFVISGVRGRAEAGVVGAVGPGVRAEARSSGRVAVFVDEPAAGGVSFDRSARHDRDDIAVIRGALSQRPMRPMRVVVVDVFDEQCS